MMELKNENLSGGPVQVNPGLKGGIKQSSKNVQRKLTSRKRINSGLKARPLQASTNTIHATQPLLNSKKCVPEPTKLNDLKKKQTNLQAKGTSLMKKVDENHTTEFFEDPYDPISDICALDEGLYKKVCELELADDGLPSFQVDEPFDF